MPTTTTTETPCVQRIAYSPIPTQSIEVGTNKTINLNNFFTQLDGQPLSYVANDTSQYLDSVSVAGSQLTMFANSGNLCGTDNTGVLVFAYDGITGNCEYGAYITVSVFGCTVETTTTLPTTTTTSTTTTTEPTTTTTEPTTTTTSTSTTTLPTTTTTEGTTTTTTEGTTTTTEPTTTTTSTSTTSTSTTSTSTTTLFESYPYEISIQSSSANACYEELVETVYTDVPTLAGIQNGTIFWTDEARTTLKNGGFYAYGLGNVADVYGSKSCRISTSGVVSQLANCVTTTIAPTTPTGTINNTFVGFENTGAAFDVFTNNAVQTYIDFTIYPTGGGSYFERTGVPTVNGTLVSWIISWNGDISTTDGGTGVANLVATNNLGTESTLDSDSFIIPATSVPDQVMNTGGWAQVGISFTRFGYSRGENVKGSLTDSRWRPQTDWTIRVIENDVVDNFVQIVLRRGGLHEEPAPFTSINFDATPFTGSTIITQLNYADIDVKSVQFEADGYTYTRYKWNYNTDTWGEGAEVTITFN